MVKNASAWVYGDRLGSIGKYYPYGQERPSATQNGTEKFTGYLRDAESGNDYAVNRYMQPGMGRFLTADRWRTGAPNALTLPDNWNRYLYVGGDPVNRTDPSGLCSPDVNPPCYSTTGTGMMGGGLNGSPGLESPHPPGPVDDGDNQTAAQIEARKAVSMPQQVIANLLASAQPVSDDLVNSETQVAGNLAMLALQNNPDCAALFEGIQGDPDPSWVLGGILSGTEYGTLNYTFMGASNVTATSYSINNATTSPVLPYNSATGTFSSATITINTSSIAPYNFAGTSPVDRAVTLLHELGHVFEYLFGAASTEIQDDQASGAVSAANTALVKSKCFP